MQYLIKKCWRRCPVTLYIWLYLCQFFCLQPCLVLMFPMRGVEVSYSTLFLCNPYEKWAASAVFLLFIGSINSTFQDNGIQTPSYFNLGLPLLLHLNFLMGQMICGNFSTALGLTWTAETRYLKLSRRNQNFSGECQWRHEIWICLWKNVFKIWYFSVNDGLWL